MNSEIKEMENSHNIIKFQNVF